MKCPGAPKKAKYFKSQIAKWKSSKSLKYSCSRHTDSEEGEFVMLTQSLSGNNVNMILLKSEQVKTLIIELTKAEETFSDKVTEEDDEFLVIDEWDINSPSSKYRRFMVDAFFELLRPSIYDIRAKHCEGCIESYPSQLHHYLLKPQI